MNSPDAMNGSDTTEQGARSKLVWDLPVRVFHWALVLLVVSQIVTVSIGGNLMEFHVLGGYALLALVTFRVIWGVLGTRTARFANFLRGPRAVISYARTLSRREPGEHSGHNPLGGWSVLAMLTSLMVQAVSGLFVDDEIMTTGPLWKYVSDDAASLFNIIHESNATILMALICLHLAAILFYLIRKKQNLIVPMFSGRKSVDAEHGESLRPLEGVLRALVVLIICAAGTWVIASL